MSTRRAEDASGPVAHVTWAKGGHAEVVALTGESIVLRSTTPAPPGARLEAKLDRDPSLVVKVKSYGTHKEADGSFTLKGRLIDATRELRDRLAALSARS